MGLYADLPSRDEWTWDQGVGKTEREEDSIGSGFRGKKEDDPRR